MSRTLSVLAVALLLTLSAAAQEAWQLDPPHSSAQFSVTHLGISTVRGAFTKISGDVNYSPSDLSKASLDITIDASSVDTRVAMRDNDLRSEHFLDVAKYPTITFKSKKVEADGPGKWKVTGELTLHGVTKEVVLEIDGPTPPVKDPMGNMRAGASATTTISRKDFGLTWNKTMESGGVLVGDEVKISIDVEAVKKPGA